MSARRCGSALLVVAACTAGLVGPAAAAQLIVRAPDGCAEANDVRDQVDGLLGRPLAAVAGVDFDVEIWRAPGATGWRLRVDAIDRAQGSAGGKRTRELAGKTCTELADAAAVAIAMSVRAAASAQPARAAPAPPAPLSPAPAPAPAVVATTAPPAAEAARGGPRVAVGLAIVAEAGGLPSVGPGAALEASLEMPVLRLIATGALFGARDAHAGAVAGTFQLAFGALMACAPKPMAGLIVLGCLGGEAGRLAGEGEGVAAPRLGSTLWIAARVDAGVVVPVSSRLSVVVRAGAAVPLQRPVFVIDGMTRVYQSALLAGRGTVGLQIEF